MQTVTELSLFTKQADKLFTDDERLDLVCYLSENPLAGDVIPGTGGIRKVRVALVGRGKRGGARVVYYFHDETMPLYALAVYAKNEKIDLSPDEKKALSKLVKELKNAKRSQKP